MHVLDASSIIYAWDNYPIGQFPPMWRWLAGEVAANRLVIPAVALVEVTNKAPDLGAWLVEKQVTVLQLGARELAEAARVKALLGIQGDAYHPKGVGENDLFIVACSKVRNLPLLSDEERQPNPPQVLSKMKIPRVCDLGSVGVPCTNFLSYLKQSAQVFGA